MDKLTDDAILSILMAVYDEMAQSSTSLEDIILKRLQKSSRIEYFNQVVAELEQDFRAGISIDNIKEYSSSQEEIMYCIGSTMARLADGLGYSLYLQDGILGTFIIKKEFDQILEQEELDTRITRSLKEEQEAIDINIDEDT